MQSKEYIRQFLINGAYQRRITPLKWITKKYVTPAETVFLELLNKYNVDLVIDIGANYGQFAKSVFKSGYMGDILSFEPLSAAFDHLTTVSKYYPGWQVKKMALGDTDGVSTINVSASSASSSLLDMHNNHLAAAPQTFYVGKEEIEVARLDSIFDSIKKSYKSIFLKIDTQGFEQAVLNGAQRSLPAIVGMQLEMSFKELYHGETLFAPMMEQVTGYGFSLCQINEGLRESNTGQLLQADAVFFRLAST